MHGRMHVRRNRWSGELTKSLKPAPSSTGSLSKLKRSSGRSLRKHDALQYALTFFVGCIVVAYFFAMSYIMDGSNASGEKKRYEPPEPKSDKKPHVNVYADVKEWRPIEKSGRATAEGQQLLREQQEHVPRDLAKIIQEMQLMKDKHEPVRRGMRSEYNLFKPFTKKNRVQLDKKLDKKGNVVYTPITSVKKDDLLDMGYNSEQIAALGNLTYEEAIKGRKRLVDILHEAGIDEIVPEAVAALPKWSSVKKLYGDEPVILGLERCEAFRAQADPIDASIGIAGMFNTGTNPMAMYVSNNCKMPNNKKDKAGGTRWQVPWGKHRLASEKLTNTPTHEKQTNKTNVLPVVLVRDPYTWMQSMCKHKYESRWPHGDNNCPNLAKRKLKKDGTAERVPLTVKYNPPIKFDSLADYWGQWYKEYLEADYPRLIVRFEDIHFHARELVETICQCAGGVPREKDGLFRYVVDSAKWGKAHQSKSNMISTMVKYGNDKNRFNGFKDTDWLIANEVYSPEIMELFGYEIPEQLRKSAQ